MILTMLLLIHSYLSLYMIAHSCRIWHILILEIFLSLTRGRVSGLVMLGQAALQEQEQQEKVELMMFSPTNGSLDQEQVLVQAMWDEKSNNNSNNSTSTTNYRVSHTNPEDFTISMLVNPCGANGTHNGADTTIALGYDCCMHQFGQGEYGYLKYIDGRELSDMEALEKRYLARQDEVWHNIVLVNENGDIIPYESSRRADDHIEIDESCTGLRKPHTYCWGNRLKAIPSPYVPSCWDHNQTVDATLRCYDPWGRRKPNCMQVSYSQNAIINICNSSSSNHAEKSSDANCGTFIEIHQHSSLSHYESTLSVLAESKISTEVTSGMYTMTIDLTYKNDKNKLLCNLKDSNIHVGSMVKILNHSPLCCCPPKYDHNTQKGSFFCPVKDFEGSGPFATKHVTLEEKIKFDEQSAKYPQCHNHSEDEDVLMCNVGIADFIEGVSNDVLRAISGSKAMIMPKRCIPIQKLSNGSYTSTQLDGLYSGPCPHGKTFHSCGTSSSRERGCMGNDFAFSFQGRIGKVVSVPNKKENDVYGITFNNGRTVYYFPKHEIAIQKPDSNYELWFVHRNRYERVIHKRKGFKVIWPPCSFDLKRNRYLPYTQISNDGELLEVFG
jgi:hypothetical protein